MIRTVLALIFTFALVLLAIRAPAESLANCEASDTALIRAGAACEDLQNLFGCAPLQGLLGANLFTSGPETISRPYALSPALSPYMVQLKALESFEKLIHLQLLEIRQRPDASVLSTAVARLRQVRQTAPVETQNQMDRLIAVFLDVAEPIVLADSWRRLIPTLAANDRAQLSEDLLNEFHVRRNASADRALNELASLDTPYRRALIADLQRARRSSYWEGKFRALLDSRTLSPPLRKLILAQRPTSRVSLERLRASLESALDNPPASVPSLAAVPVSDRSPAAVSDSQGESSLQFVRAALFNQLSAGKDRASAEERGSAQSCLGKIARNNQLDLPGADVARLADQTSFPGGVRACRPVLDGLGAASLLKQRPSQALCRAMEAITIDRLAKISSFQPDVEKVSCDAAGLSAKLRIDGLAYSVQIRQDGDALVLRSHLESASTGQNWFECALQGTTAGGWRWCQTIKRMNSVRSSDSVTRYPPASALALDPGLAWRKSGGRCITVSHAVNQSNDDLEIKTCHASQIIQATNVRLRPALTACFAGFFNGSPGGPQKFTAANQ